MGFLSNAIRKGVGDAVSKAVGGAIKEAVTPVAQKYADKAAEQLDQASAVTSQQINQANTAMQGVNQEVKQSGGFSNLEGSLANFQRSMENYATEAAKNMKTCSSCGETTFADKKFCPSCGAKLPDETLAQATVCPSCGTQNVVGTKFCQECGSKLPLAYAEEENNI